MFCFGRSFQVSAQVAQQKTFTITGYYSPLPDQEYFLTGSYESEIRLNGRGTNGADGTPVFPGMIAAPSTMAFGTKICIPQFGCGEVHDRGGAIVNQGERQLAKYDRLDLWLGYGDEGLRRALAWGVRHLDCEMYGVEAPIEVSVNFDVPMPLAGIIVLPNRQTFANNLWKGTENDEVKKLQEILAKMSFYDGEVNGKYDEFLAEAVFSFQKKYFILQSWDESGAGVFGPKTRKEMENVLFHFETQEKIREMWESFHFENNISRGQRNADVLKLQQMLVKTEYMDVLPTGFLDPKHRMHGRPFRWIMESSKMNLLWVQGKWAIKHVKYGTNCSLKTKNKSPQKNKRWRNIRNKNNDFKSSWETWKIGIQINWFGIGN
ncbi:hypothetical protein HC823_00775 [Candidatus Gracilibacteria bacterium]|nr:hypothetical protein [Candidatus Gracilibacteria bacterium]